MFSLRVLAAFAIVAAVPVFAQLAVAPGSTAAAASQINDEDFARSVKLWTTRPEFVGPLVGHLPKLAGIPSPKDVLGYHIGTPKKLTRVSDIGRYYRALAAASPRVKLLPAGTTDEGRECLIIAISDEDSIRDLERHRALLARLADPRGLTSEAAEQVIGEAKPIYMFFGGLHSGETGPPEMLMELAYRLAVEDSPLFKQIRRNLIVMLSAVAEPDGRDRYVDWYYRHKLTEETEADRVAGPPYWGKYVFHDNNRDINYSQVTMRNWLNFYLQWHPPIIHDLHESVPFLYTFSGQAPQNPTLDPLLYAELPWFANFEMAKMIGYGMPGVWTHGFVDMWSPGYLGFMSSNHNGMLRMYETFGNGGANTMKRTVEPPDGEGGGGGDRTTRQWYRPMPPYKEVVWSMRNNINYMETGALSALELGSGFAKILLRNFYEKSLNSIRSGSTEAPFGYVLRAGQPDMTRVAMVVNLLRVQGIEVGRATTEFKIKDRSFPTGSFVIKRNQPYGRLAKILLEKQAFPDANLRTYDDTGWTMGLMSQTQVEEIGDKSILDLTVEPVDKAKIDGTVKGDGPLLAVLDNGANNMATLRYRLKGDKVEAVDAAFKEAGTDIPAGSLLISANSEVRDNIQKLGLNAVAIASAPKVPKHTLSLPRLAVFSTWGNTQEVGWVRHAFDQFEITYDLIYKERVRKGNLRASYDVILIPNQGRGSAKALVFDVESKGKPLDYKHGTEFRSLGEYGESDDITGGMGLPGAEELNKFVQAGGVLITLGASSFFPAEFGLVRQLDAGRTSPAFYAPGPIVETEVLEPTHPIFYGYSEKKLPVRYANGPILRVPTEYKKAWVLAQFIGAEQSILSGLMKGAAETKGRPAILNVPVAKGRVVMFATNPCYRWQNFGEFRMLFNTILNFNHLSTSGR